MFEVAIDFNLVEHFGGAALVPQRGQLGYPRIRSHERRPFATAGGYACILPYSDRNWRDFSIFTARDDLLQDARFETIATRQDHFETLYAAVREEAPRWTTAEWVAFCESADIPCMPVIGLADIFEDPHVRAVNLFETAEHPGGGTYRTIRPPVTFSASPYRLDRHAPHLGEHTQEILRELAIRAND